MNQENHEHNPFDDAAVMARVQRGRIDLLALIFERYHRPMYGFFVHATRDRAVSKDLVQDVFERLIRYTGSYDPSRPFRPWLYRIGRNVLLDHQSSLPPTTDQAIPEAGHEPVDAMESAELSRSLDEAMRMLPPDKRELLVLSQIVDLSYPELATLYDLSVNATRVRVFRALQALRNEFHGDQS